MFDFLRRLLKPAQQSHIQLLKGFESNREHLTTEFFRRAAASGKPRGLRWTGCTWLETKALVRDSQTGLVTLFCGVNLTFEAVEGGDMEDVEAVSSVRDGSAVFHCQDGRWGTGGRVLFNLDPESATQVATPGQERLA